MSPCPDTAGKKAGMTGMATDPAVVMRPGVTAGMRAVVRDALVWTESE